MRNFNENFSSVRGLHAVVGGDTVDIYLNGNPFFYNIKFTDFTPYVYVPEGKYTVEVFPRDQKENPIVTGTIEVSPGELITIAITGESDKTIEILQIKEEMETPTGNKSRARFIHLVPNGRPVDILLDKEMVLEDVEYKEVTPYTDVDPKTYQVDVLLNENGQLMISKESIDNMVKNAVASFDKVKQCNTKIDVNSENQLRITLFLVVGENVIIKELASSLQKKIKEEVKKISDLEVEEVNVKVTSLQDGKKSKE